MSKRKTWNEYFMEITDLVASRSTCDRAMVGCLIVNDDNRIVSSGYNGSVSGMPHCDDVGHTMRDGHCIATIHAEMNACLAAGRQNCIGATLYLAGWRVDQNKNKEITPCLMCSRVIKNSGIIEVVS